MKPKYRLNLIRKNAISLSSIVIVCLCSSAMGQTDNNWTGTASSDWNTPGNWSLGAVPTKAANQHAVINTNSPNKATITAGIIAPVDIMVGTNATATLNHRSGDAYTGSTNWMFVGRNAGGNGTYNLANDLATGGALTGLGQGSGNMTVSGGRLWIGGFTGNATGVCNVHTTGVLAVGSDLSVGAAGGTGTMNIDSGTITTGGWNFIGKNEAGTGAKGTLNMGGGTFTNNGRQYVGSPTCEGWFNLTGGTFTNNSNLLIGGTTDGDDFLGTSADGKGHLTVSGNTTQLTVGGEFTLGNRGSEGDMTFGGGTIESRNWTQIGRNGGKGTLTMTGGTWNKTNSGDFVVGDFGNATGTMTMSGGTLNNANTFRISSGGTGTVTLSGGTITNNNEFWVGQAGSGTLNFNSGSLTVGNWIAIGRGGGTGNVIMSGGSWTKNASDSNFIIGSSGPGTMSMSGGTVTVADSGPLDRGVTWIAEGNNCTGTLNLSGSAQFTSERFVLAVNGGTTGNFNLNGGTITTGHILGGNGTANVSFNGTQILASATSTDFIQNLDSAVVNAGGLKIDSGAFNQTVPQLLTAGSPSGGLVKSGSGTLTLSAANSYTGATSVNGGTLAITTASLANGAVTLADATALGVTQTTANQAYSTSAATFGAADATTLDLNLGAFAGNTTNAPLNVSGSAALTLNGVVTVNVTDNLPVVGVVPLVSYTGGKSGSGSFQLGTLPDGVKVASNTLVDNLTNLVSINITRVNDAYWTGAVSSTWDTSTANWKDDYAETASIYADGDPVMFDDRVVDVGPAITVTLNSTVAPGDSGVTFANATKNYTLSGTGKITGSKGLTKEAAGMAIIATANDYTGATTVAGGLLVAPSLADQGAPCPIGLGSGGDSPNTEDYLILNGGGLYYVGPSTSIDRGFTVGNIGGGIGTDNDLTLSGPAYTTGGDFIKGAAGNLILTNGLNIFNGQGAEGITVEAGTLTFDGTDSAQVNSVTKDIWVGTTSATGANLVLNNTTMSSSGNYLAIARGSGTTGLTSTCTLTNSTLSTGNLSLGYANGVAGYLATAVLTLNDATYTMTGTNKLAESGGSTGTVVLNGNSHMTTGDSNISQDSGSNGTLNVKGTSVYTSNGRLQVGANAGSTGNVIIENSGSVVVNSWVSVGYNGAGSMTVKNNGTFSNNDDFSINENSAVPANVTLQDNGSITVGKVVFVGRNVGRVGTLTQTGGTFTGNGNEFQIGKSGSGTWLQSGGLTNAGGWVSIGRETGGTGVLTVSGTGTFNQTGADRALIVGENGTGTLNVQGTATVSSVGSNGVLVSNFSAGVGTVNLDGGTLAALKFADGGGSSTFNFNGGVLKANAGAAATFMAGLDNAVVKSGGANIDSNGQTININQALLDGSGGGGLTKTGAGTLRLNGANTYTGATTVNAGTLGGTGSVAGPLTVSAAGTIAPGASVGTFTVGGNTTISGTYACEINGATADVLAVAGDLNLTGSTITVNATAPSGTQWLIATYTGSLTGTLTPPSGYTVDTATPGQVKLIQSATPYSSWAQANITNINPTADATPGGDPDGDGVKNIAEFALNGNPLSGASTGKVVGKIAPVGGSPTLVISLPVRNGATFSGSTEQISALVDGIVYRIQGSDQLSTWNLVVSEVLGADKTAIESGLPAPESGWTRRTFQSPGSITGDPADFLRAVIESP